MFEFIEAEGANWPYVWDDVGIHTILNTNDIRPIDNSEKKLASCKK